MNKQRIRAGERFPLMAATGRSAWVCVPDGRPAYVHLQFCRFVGCPITTGHLQAFADRHQEIQWAGIREVVVLRSTHEDVEARHDSLPFDVIPDPDGLFHEHCAVGTSWSALWDFRALESVFTAICGRNTRFGTRALTEPWFALPADFLLSGDGVVQALHYGCHAADRWSVDDLMVFRSLLDK